MKKEIYFYSIALLFLACLAIAVYTNTVHPLLLILYLALSLLTFLAYAKDKSAAEKGNWRIPENTLHGLALFGGWPGALIAQQLLRHKSKKQSFRNIFYITVALNCLVLFWFIA